MKDITKANFEEGMVNLQKSMEVMLINIDEAQYHLTLMKYDVNDMLKEFNYIKKYVNEIENEK